VAKFRLKIVKYNCVYFFGRSKGEPLSLEGVSSLTGVAIRQASRKDITRFERCRLRDRAQFEKKAYEGLERLRKGNQCFLVMHEGRLIAKAWATKESTWYISELEADEMVGSEAVIIFDCATLPEYRGRHIFPLILRHINNQYPDRRKVIYCVKENLSSRRAIEHDFTLEKKAYFLKVLGVSFHWSRTNGSATIA